MLDAPPTPAIRKSAAPLRHQVLDFLRQSIISGRLPPGSRLVERELIEMMDVSRTVIREALRQLETEGLVATIANKGPVVRELSAGEAKDLYAIREVLVGLAARLFVLNAKPGQIDTLRLALEEVTRCYAAGDPGKILQAKNSFYDALVSGAGSESLSSMISILHARIWRWRALGLTHPKRSPKRSRESVSALRAMFAAIKAGNAAQAETLAREETAQAATEVIHLLEEPRPAGN
jgi:DNA-binding GntR family transcriptional regulator